MHHIATFVFKEPRKGYLDGFDWRHPNDWRQIYEEYKKQLAEFVQKHPEIPVTPDVTTFCIRHDIKSCVVNMPITMLYDKAIELLKNNFNTTYLDGAFPVSWYKGDDRKNVCVAYIGS